MKTSRILLGLVAIMFAAVSAYASTKSLVVLPVFYETSTACVQGYVLTTCDGNDQPCVKDIYNQNETPRGITEPIFASQGDLVNCAQPYKLP